MPTNFRYVSSKVSAFVRWFLESSKSYMIPNGSIGSVGVLVWNEST